MHHLKLGRNGALRPRRSLRVARAVSGVPQTAEGVDTLLSDLQPAAANPRWLAAKLLQAQERERARVARELHDVINQKLALLLMELGSLSRNSAIAEPLREELLRLRGEAEELTREVRGLSHQLHPATLEQLGLLPALKGFCRQFATREGIDLTFESNPVPAAVNPEIALGIFRIAQEALRNVAKHAHASKAHVSLQLLRRKLSLQVSDDGVGFSTSVARRSGGIGLASMRERAILVGGKLEVRSTAAGTTIRVEIPHGGRSS